MIGKLRILKDLCFVVGWRTISKERSSVADITGRNWGVTSGKMAAPLRVKRALEVPSTVSKSFLLCKEWFDTIGKSRVVTFAIGDNQPPVAISLPVFGSLLHVKPLPCRSSPSKGYQK